MQTPATPTLTSYRRIRKSIGTMGAGLPWVLVGLSGIHFFGTEVQPSISDYYYTNFRELFTGTLCAVSLFLIRYVGYKDHVFWKNDNLMTNIAGVMALGVALFPTQPDDYTRKIYTIIPLPYDWLGWLHYGFAAVFFIILANMSINVFTIGQQKNKNIPLSIVNENNIYRTCGYTIYACLVCIPIFAYYKLITNSTLLFETIALNAFGIAWLIKGRALGDKGRIGRMVYREEN